MHTPLITLMITALKKTSGKVVRDFSELEKMVDDPKKAIEFAMQTDKVLKEDLHKDIAKIKKNYSFIIGDTTLKNKDESNYFILHGIMGLDNFYRSMPYFCLAISLERDNELFATVIYNPITHEMFYAEKNLGAFYNRKILKYVNFRDARGLKYIAIDKEAIKDTNLQTYQDVSMNSCILLSLCYLATNKINNCNFKGRYSKINLLPAILLLEECGINIKYELDNKDITNINFFK